MGDAIDKYMVTSMKEIGKTKAQVLRTIQNEYTISKKASDSIKAQHIVAFAEKLRNRPNLSAEATVLNDLAHLSAVVTIARPAWGFELDAKESDDAIMVCKRMGSPKSAKRSRHPNLDK